MLTITLGRASLGLEPLIITGSRETTTSGMWIPEGGLQLQAYDMRRTYAPTSAYVRRKLLAAILDGADLSLTVRMQGSATDSLSVRRTTLEQAVSQFLYPITVDIDGNALVGEAECSWPALLTPTPSDRLLNRGRCQLLIPVNP